MIKPKQLTSLSHHINYSKQFSEIHSAILLFTQFGVDARVTVFISLHYITLQKTSTTHTLKVCNVFDCFSMMNDHGGLSTPMLSHMIDARHSCKPSILSMPFMFLTHALRSLMEYRLCLDTMSSSSNKTLTKNG